MLITISYEVIVNTNKIVTHIPKLRVGQCSFLFDIRYYLKISLIYSKFLK